MILYVLSSCQKCGHLECKLFLSSCLSCILCDVFQITHFNLFFLKVCSFTVEFKMKLNHYSRRKNNCQKI